MSAFKSSTVCLAVAACVAGGALPASSAGAETVFRFNTWLPKNHNIHMDVIEPMSKEFESRTAGRAKIAMTASSMGPPATQFDMIGSGVIDLAFTLHGYTPGRFPMMEIVSLPFLGDRAEALSVAFWRVNEKHLDKAGEHAQVKLLGLNTHGGGPVFTKAPFKRIADLKGQKMIVTNGNVAKMAESLGAAAVLAQPPQWFEMLSHGVADGALLSIDAPFKFKVAKFVPHFTAVPGGLYNQSFALIMNKAKWDSLTAADRQSLQTLFGETTSRRMGKSYDDSEAIAIKAYPQDGVKLDKADANLVQEMRSRLSAFEGAWIEAAGKKGVDGREALKMLRAEAAKEQGKS